MRDEFEAYLYNKYGNMFPEEERRWGLSCGDGWFKLIDNLCSSIKWHMDWQAKQGNNVKPVKVLQVKEKFGGLRFYYEGGNEYVHGLVDMTESMSESTCEECGAPGQKRGSGWIKTLCETHAKDKDYISTYNVDVGDTVSLFTKDGYESVSVVNILAGGVIEVLDKNNATLQVKRLVVGGVELNAYIA
jgi:hypothetical protein